jgi:hypothetical protein
MRNNTQSSEVFVAAGKKTKEKKYWLNQLGGELVKSVFPFDYQGSEKSRNKYEIKNKYNPFNLPGEISGKLVKMAGDSDLRLFVIFVSLLALLLNRYTGNTDIIVGSPVYRGKGGGEWLNTAVALRIHVEEHLSFKQLVLQVGKIIFEATEHQNYPLNVLLDL